jgi:CRP/FNR family cyclic AMP-dependent transcriptional regulator
MSLLDNEPRSASAVAVTDVELIVLGREALVVLFERHPGVALNMLEIMTRRLRDTTALVQDRILPNVNEEIAVKRSVSDQISDLATRLTGNIYFVALCLVWFVVWIVWNLGVVPGLAPFDPFPFGLLTMIVSLQMVFLSLFILIKQERQAANDKVRNDIEYEINVRAELGVRALHKQLELLEYRMAERFERLEQTSDWEPDGQAIR